MFERLTKALRATGLEPDWRDLADVLWLAQLGRPSVEAPGTGSQAAEATSGEAQAASPTSEPATTWAHGGADYRCDHRVGRSGFRDRARPEPRRRRSPACADHLPGTSVQCRCAVRTSRRLALPGHLKIARALRPLRQSRASRRDLALDVDRTVDFFCQTEVLMPILGPTPGALVRGGRPRRRRRADDGRVGRDGRRAGRPAPTLRRLRSGVTLDTKGGGGAVQLRSVTGRDHPLHQLVDYDGRRLVPVVTDCVGPLWSGPTAWEALGLWGKHGPLALRSNPSREALAGHGSGQRRRRAVLGPARRSPGREAADPQALVVVPPDTSEGRRPGDQS